MNKVLIGFVGLIYFIVGIRYFLEHNYGFGIIWTGYALANMGFMLI